MTTYLHRQPDPWHPRLTLGDHVDFAAKVEDKAHLALLQQWDEPGYTPPPVPRRETVDICPDCRAVTEILELTDPEAPR